MYVSLQKNEATDEGDGKKKKKNNEIVCCICMRCIVSCRFFLNKKNYYSRCMSLSVSHNVVFFRSFG